MKKTALFATMLMLASAFLNTGILGLGPKALADGADVLTLNEPFKQALVAAHVDANGDGSITQAEMAAPHTLEITGYTITDVSGIEYATGLTSLTISGTGITSLPSGFSGLTGLTSLDLSNNDFSTFPGELAGMAGLKTLDLKLNSISSLPASIDGMTGLQELNLYHNTLESLPSAIGSLSNLTKLYLHKNNLTALPDSIGSLTKLADLTIWDNNITALPASMKNLTALTDELDMSENRLTALPSGIFDNMKSLQTLKVEYNWLDPQAGSADRVELDKAAANGTAVTYARQNTYAVSLNFNGGSGAALPKQQYYHGEIITLPSATKTGYELSGWDINGDGLWEKKAGDTVTVAPSPVTVSSVEYKAIYGYTVTFKAQPYGKIGGDTKDIVLYVSPRGQVAAADIPSASADSGYTSLGWYDGIDSITPDAISKLTINANKVFTACFEAVGTIHFHDTAFKVALTAAGADENSDGFITETELGDRTTLTLSGGHFTDIREIGYAASLESLTLGAGMVSVIPSELGNCKALKSLDIGGNPVASLPAGIGNLIHLETLKMDHTGFTALPSEILTLSTLKSLDASNDNFTALPSGLNTLTSLETLKFSGSKFAAFPAVLKGMAGIKTLDISDNLLTDLPSDCFSGMTGLTALDLRANYFYPEAMPVGIPAFAQKGSQKTYTVTLDFNRGTGTPLSPQEYWRGQTIQLPTATRKDYTFVGWDTDGDGDADTDGAGTAVLAPTPPDAYASKTFTAIYDCLNARLSGIALSAGASISPVFDTDTLAYEVYIPDSVSSVTLTPTAATGCTFTMDGQDVSDETVQLPLGGHASVTILCSKAGKNNEAYAIDIYRIAPVTAIAATGAALSPAFSVGTQNYSVSLPATAAVVSLAPQTSASCKSVTIDGEAVLSKTISPNPGCKTDCVIRAVAANNAVFTYTVSVTRAALLAGVKVSAGTLSPAFSADVTSYTVDVAATVTQVTITPAKAASAKTLLIDGKKATSKKVSPPVGGSCKPVLVTVQAADGKTQAVYSFTVRRASLVASIGVAGYDIHFSTDKPSYTLDIPADAGTATVTAASAATGAKPVTINGVAQTSKTFSLPLPGSSAVATVAGVSTNGKVKSAYTVVIRRAPIVAGIQVTGGSLSPAFNATNGTYYVNIPATVAGVTLQPIKGADCPVLSINGDNTISNILVQPSIGERKTVTIAGSTALGTPSAYTVYVTRAALVTSITSGTKGYALNTAFTPTTMTYTIHLPYNVSSVVIKASAAKGVKTFTLYGKKGTSYTAKPPVGGSVDVPIVAATSDKVGSASVTYHVIVMRDALVSGISVSGESSPMLAPAFDPVKTGYTVNLPADVDSVTVQPVPVAANVLSVTIDGVAQVSKTVSPPAGGSVAMTIVVTGKDGKTKSTYTVTVNRATTS